MQRSVAVQAKRLIDLNVLPSEMRPLRYPGWYVPGLIAIVIGCILLVPAIGLQRSADRQTASLSRQLFIVTGQLTDAQVDFGRARGFRAQIAQAEASLSAVQAERKTVLGMDEPLSQGLLALYAAAPPGLQINSVTKVEGKVTASGNAPSIDSVIAFATALKLDGTFPEVTITSVGGAGPLLAFSVEVAQ